MSTSSPVRKRTSALLSIIFFLPAIILFILWNTTGSVSGSLGREERTDAFLDFFPSWMQSMGGIHIFSIVCCVIAIALATGSFKKKKLSIRLAMLMVVFVSIFFILFDIYQLLA